MDIFEITQTQGNSKLKEKTQTQEISLQKIKQKAQFSLFFFTEPLILCSKTFRYSSFRYSVNKKPRRRPFFRYYSEFRYLGFRYSSRYLYRLVLPELQNKKETDADLDGVFVENTLFNTDPLLWKANKMQLR